MPIRRFCGCSLDKYRNSIYSCPADEFPASAAVVHSSEKSSLGHAGKRLARCASLLFLFAATHLHAQGPPYQTDDPVPVDLHHYEFYIFGGVDGTPAEMDSTGPAFEFNWGAIPRVQLHAILPWGVVAPSNNPVYLPGGTGPRQFGLTDMELGAKIAFIKETQTLSADRQLHHV